MSKKTKSEIERVIERMPERGHPDRVQRRLDSFLYMIQPGEAGDDLLTKDQIYKKFKDRKWCPDSPAAVAIALSRAGLAPEIQGRRGGAAACWKLSDAVAALKQRARSQKKTRK